LSKKDKFGRIPSPCIDICKDRHGRCIACGRSEKDKRKWKKAESEDEQLALIAACLALTGEIGTRAFWEREYRRKCRKKGAICPLDSVLRQAS
jgi:uncharacterized protein